MFRDAAGIGIIRKETGRHAVGERGEPRRAFPRVGDVVETTVVAAIRMLRGVGIDRLREGKRRIVVA